MEDMTGTFVRRHQTIRSRKGMRRCFPKSMSSAALLLLTFGALYFVQSRIFSRPPIGCNAVTIWSHRGHLDSSSPENQEWTCDHVLATLHENGINHLDVDLLFYKGESIVAHPVEMSPDLDPKKFSPSPCSKIPLKVFIQKLKQYYGPTGFYVSMEPKSGWTPEEAKSEFMSPPQDVIGGILSVLDEEPVANCGIILQGWQFKDARLPTGLHDRIRKHCDLVLPLKRTDGPFTEAVAFPYESKMSMPTIELMGRTDGHWFLKESQKRGIEVVLWVVDTVQGLQNALSWKGVGGVISNHPVRLKKMYQDMCGGEYSM